MEISVVFSLRVGIVRPMPHDITPRAYQYTKNQVNACRWASKRRSERESAAGLALVRAAMTFDPARGRCFESHAFEIVKQHLYKLLAKETSGNGGFNNRMRPMLGGDPEPTESQPLPGDKMELSQEYSRCTSAIARLSPRNGLCFMWWLFDGMTYEAIGHQFGVTKQRIEQIIKHSLDELRMMLRINR